MKKSILLTLVAVTFLSLGTVLAQDKAGKKANFYNVVPKHEFFFEGFGGFAPFFYDATTYAADLPVGTAMPDNVSESFKSTLWPWQAADWMTKKDFLKYPVGLGYGAGFGYIAHITPTVGIMTGFEAAMYHGGINMINDNESRIIWTTGFQADPAGSGTKNIHAVALQDYSETQQYLAVQIPLMLHLMAPMGKGNNFFYAALGAKIGFNVWGQYQGRGEAVYQTTLPYSETWKDFASVGNLFGEIPYTGNPPGTYATPDGKDGYGSFVQKNQWDGNFSSAGDVYVADYLITNLINAMASVELGFRWKFGGGCGLYTGLYADFGFLPMTSNNTGEAIYSQNGPYQSIIACNGLPDYFFKTENAILQEYMNNSLPKATSPVYSLHAGLKMKIAFGKVKKAPAPTPIPAKPDTVVKTVVQTVVVRDTVTNTNTVVVRDTVEKVKVIRDTVVVIKEVPQEIKDVMVELSNTLFAFNKFNLTDKAKEGLNKVAKWLNDNPEVQCEISGHTDGIGTDAYNQKLSEDRAKSVYEYFIHEGGVSSKRLSYKGYGKTRPIATNDTEEGRQQNRRVELNIIQ